MGVRKRIGGQKMHWGSENTASPCRCAKPRPGGGTESSWEGSEWSDVGKEMQHLFIRAWEQQAGLLLSPRSVLMEAAAAQPVVGCWSGAGSPWLHLQSVEGSEA